MLKRNDDLIINRGLIPANINCSSPQIAADNAAFIATLIADGGVLPQHPPFEIHPYLNEFPLQNYEKYIIGTFPPISYLRDHPNPLAPALAALTYPAGGAIPAPWIPFYHGNRGNMWEYILNAPEYAMLEAIVPNGVNPPINRVDAKNYLVNFLNTNEINYSDIILSAQREAYNANDKGLYNICVNKELICHVLGNDNVKAVMFNTGSTFRQIGLKLNQLNRRPQDGAPGTVYVSGDNTSSFDLFVRGCQEMNLKVEIRINAGIAPNFGWTEISSVNAVFLNNNLSSKLVFEMKISETKSGDSECSEFSGEKILTVLTPVSPAAVRRGMTKRNLVIQTWALHNGIPANLITHHTVISFLKYVYVQFRNGNFTLLYQYNH
ncbi:MAG: hypothetical protein K2Q24_16235 [Chitinophagaceae bacterium]|nr:hypothetical protein [Chitinophagaceae bacterium]